MFPGEPIQVEINYFYPFNLLCLSCFKKKKILVWFLPLVVLLDWTM